MVRERRPTPVSEIVASAVRATEPAPVDPDLGREEERNFDVLRTHIPGFFLLVDEGANPDLTRSETEDLYAMGPAFVARAATIKRLEEIQGARDGPRDDLVGMGQDIPGFRGGRDTEAGWEIQITPRKEDIFLLSRLHASLGEDTSKYVHTNITVSVELDPEEDDIEGFKEAMKRRLRRQGSDAEVDTDVAFRVDKEALKEAVDSGEVTLMEGAWVTTIKNWAVTPIVISSAQDREEADAPLQAKLDPRG